MAPGTTAASSFAAHVVTYEVPLPKIIEYVESGGSSPFAAWFGDLNAAAAAKITVALARISAGNMSNLKGVGGGVLEWKVNFGPGYRIYLGRDGDRLVILLGGGIKRRQSGDIRTAIDRWRDYRHRRAE